MKGRFSNAIKDNAEIWETQNRAVKSGDELELDIDYIFYHIKKTKKKRIYYLF